MANFTKVTPIDMGVYRNVFTEGKSLAELFTACATNGASTAAYGVYFDASARDDKYLIIINNSNASAAKGVTIKAGDDKVFGAVNDLALASIDAGDYTFITLDSGKYKQTTNNADMKTLANVTDVKGAIVIVGDSADIKVCVVKLAF